jgi:lysosomal-associated membrane protein 1/2
MIRTGAVFVALLCVSFAVHVAVRDKDLPYCILLDSDITGTIEYYNVFTNKSEQYDFVVNGTTTTTGRCHGFTNATNSSSEHFTIHFLPNDITPDPPVLQEKSHWKLTVYFESKETANSFRISDFELTAYLYTSQFNSSLTNGTAPKVTYKKAKDAEMEWSAENKNGFSCSTAGLSLTNDSTIQFKNLKVVAFGMFDTDKFPVTQVFEQCKMDSRTSDLVPIVVGACLAGLVIIVLIAYLIGRARAKRQGYASV